jgi:hypothetical protein
VWIEWQTNELHKHKNAELHTFQKAAGLRMMVPGVAAAAEDQDEGEGNDEGVLADAAEPSTEQQQQQQQQHDEGDDEGVLADADEPSAEHDVVTQRLLWITRWCE